LTFVASFLNPQKPSQKPSVPPEGFKPFWPENCLWETHSCCSRQDDSAKKLSFGFAETGQMHGDEVIAMLKL